MLLLLILAVSGVLSQDSWLGELNAVHSFRSMLCCSKCFIILEVLPPLHEISLSHVLHLAMLSSFFTKFNQTFEHLLRSVIVLIVMNCACA